MLALPPVPLQVGWRNQIRLGRDYYVRVDTNDYSVDPAVIGRMVDVTADLERVRVRARGPPRRRPRPGLGPRHDRSPTPPTSRPPRRLRKQFQQPRAAADDSEDLVRDLADYDRAFGLDADRREVS